MDTSDATPREFASAAGRVFSVRVAALQRNAYRIVIRAADEQEARRKVESRGHEVLSVHLYDRESERVEAVAPMTCMHCAYDLTRLPIGGSKQVQCPECGWVNLPVAARAVEAHRDLRRIRRRTTRMVMLLVVVSLGVLGVAGVRRLVTRAIFAPPAPPPAAATGSTPAAAGLGVPVSPAPAAPTAPLPEQP